jgi:hypothetical protein
MWVIALVRAPQPKAPHPWGSATPAAVPRRSRRTAAKMSSTRVERTRRVDDDGRIVIAGAPARAASS